MKFRIPIVLLCGILFALPIDGRAQDSVRDQLFAATDKVLADAQARQADILSPMNYTRALESYRRAEDDFQKGRNLENIRRRLKEAQVYLRKALEGVKLAEVTFATALAARNDAINAGAPRFSKETWAQAEKAFVDGAEQLEKGDVNDARRESGAAEQFYRQAELGAIKANFLLPAWTLLEKADREKAAKRAPKTLAMARELAKRAEDLLRQNRYDNDEARELAQQAKYQAKHALYLSSQVEALESKNYSFEDIFLWAEGPFSRIATSLNVTHEFDRGFTPVVDASLKEIISLQDKLQKALQFIEKRNTEVVNLREQIASMEQRLGNLTEAERALKRKLDRQRQQEAIIDDVAKTFTRAEGQVFRDGDNMIVRLYGLTFPVGRATIEPQFFSILTKVQNAIRKFPDCSVVIEGHTDSRGSDEQNQLLSEERAAAVAEYLRANMGLAANKLGSVGFGESRPIASNDSPEGRARNRRIDIVIIPAWLN